MTEPISEPELSYYQPAGEPEPAQEAADQRGPEPTAGPESAAWRPDADPALEPLRPPAEPLPETGHPAVDAALRELAAVADASPAEQLPAFQAAHRILQEALASIDEGAPPS
ncbi:MAG TPA: hypothetical protein VIL37_06465 [Natronosporangium sp.]